MAAAQPLNIIVMKRNKNCMRSLQTAAQRVCACVPYHQASLASPRKDTEQPASMAAVQRLAACVCVCVAYKQACQVSSHKDGQPVTTRQQTRSTEQRTVSTLCSVQLQNQHCVARPAFVCLCEDQQRSKRQLFLSMSAHSVFVQCVVTTFSVKRWSGGQFYFEAMCL